MKTKKSAVAVRVLLNSLFFFAIQIIGKITIQGFSFSEIQPGYYKVMVPASIATGIVFSAIQLKQSQPTAPKTEAEHDVGLKGLQP